MYRRIIFLGITVACAFIVVSALMLLVVTSGPVAADPGIHYVALGSNCGGMSPCYESIQDAVDAAGEGDEIRVASGLYSGVQGRSAPSGYPVQDVITQVIYITRTIALQGGYTTTNWTTSDPEANPTIIDGQGQGRVILIAGNISPSVEGFFITGGDAAGQGSDAGGGIYSMALSGTISNNHIFSNTAYIGGGLCFNSSSALLNSNDITTNTAQHAGAGVYLADSNVTLVGNAIKGNHFTGNVTEYGGGIHMYHSVSQLSGNVIANNSGAYYGGGVSIQYYSQATLIENTIANNAAKHGGGVSLEDGSNAELYSNILKGNSARDRGGAFHSMGGAATFDSNVIVYNTAENGGGLYLIADSNALLTNNIIADNQVAVTGGGMYIEGSSPRLVHTTIARNGGSSGIYVKNRYVMMEPPYVSNVALTNTILVSHSLGISVAQQSTVTLEATLWGTGDWANGTDWASEGTIYTVTTNIWADPLFVDPDSGDYHIQPTSPAVDAGVDSGLSHDIDGDFRPNGSGFDIGADETGFCDGVTEIPQAECEALVAFYHSTDGPHWTTNTGWLETNTPCMDWYGVECSAGQVIDLTLYRNQLSGIIPAEFGNLTSLQSLTLFSNELSGTIPQELGGLTSLQHLSLDSNQLSGNIPPELGDLISLQDLYLYNNRLSGIIPAEFGNLTSLQTLVLFSNELSGAIPPELGSLTSLQSLALYSNQLSGAIPPELGNLSAQVLLDLGYNMLTASDPALVTFLDEKDPDWADTQTVPPADLQVTTVTTSSVQLSWTPITYTADGGYYEVSYTTTTGGPYTVHGKTGDKTASSYVADGLDSDRPYYFAVRTHTPAHDDQQNDLWSWYTEEVSATTSDIPTRYVVNTGTDSGDCTNSVAPCRTVQYAADQSADGDLIKIAAGTYTGVQNIPALNTEILTATQVVAIDKSLTLRGGYTVTNWTVSDPVANPTTLDAEGLGRVLLITGEISPTIEGLRITGGNSDGLGGKFYPYYGVTGDMGGGIYAITATLAISNCVIADNVAPPSGGYPYVNRGGGIYVNSALSLMNSRIMDNTGDCTGGVRLDNVDYARVLSNTFKSNDGTNGGSNYSGGGLFAWGSDVEIRDNVFRDNHAYGGGGLSVWGGALVEGNLIEGNHAFWGGGIDIEASSEAPTLVANIIRDNLSSFEGGGIVARGLTSGPAITMENNVIAGNHLYYDGCDSRPGGTGIYLQGNLRLLHNTFAENRSGDCPSSAIYVGGSSAVTMTNTIMVSHSVGITLSEDSTVWSDGTLWGVGEWANGTDWAGDGTIYTGTTNIWADPLFVDPATGNFHIQPTSPAVDAGVPTATGADMDGEARPFGAGPDIGADEWATVQVNVDPATGATLVAVTDGLPTTIDFPAGSVTDTTVVEYTALADALEDAPADFGFAGHAFSWDAYQDGILLSSLAFIVPVTVTLEYSDADIAGLDEATLMLEWWSGSEWEDAACGPYDRHPDENWLSVPICHLSQFGLFGRATASMIYLPLVLRNSP